MATETNNPAKETPMNTTNFSAGDGTYHEAIQLSFDRVAEILGHDHDGSAEDDQALVAWLSTNGPPAWVTTAGGWIDGNGWGLIGPTL